VTVGERFSQMEDK